MRAIVIVFLSLFAGQAMAGDVSTNTRTRRTLDDSSSSKLTQGSGSVLSPMTSGAVTVTPAMGMGGPTPNKKRVRGTRYPK